MAAPAPLPIELRQRILDAACVHGGERIADLMGVHIQTLGSALLGKAVVTSVHLAIKIGCERLETKSAA